MKTRLLPLLLATVAALCALGTPSAAFAHSGRSYRAAPEGRVVVTNRSGGDVTLSLPGQPARHLDAWQTAELAAPAGETTLRATYRQFGVDQLLQLDRIYVAPGRTAAVVLAAEQTARVLVANDSPRRAELLVDGVSKAGFEPGEARVVPLRVGGAELVMVADGRAFARTRLELRAFEELRFQAVMPRTGELVVQNPLPIAIELVCSKGLVRTVPAYGRTTYAALPEGGFRLTARRLTGELVDAQTTSVRAGSTVTWSVDAPRTGLVTLDSDAAFGTQVQVDGRYVAGLGPDASKRIELALGRHEIEVRDDRGRPVYRTWIDVRPFDTSRVSFGTPYHTQARDGSRDDQRRDGHEQAYVATASESCSMR